MRVNILGAGPGGLFTAILLKKADPTHEITVVERNRPDDTFGFGVVFSDAALDNVGGEDPETHAAITRSFHHWEDIEIHYRGEVLRSSGHGFSGISRVRLLQIMQARARELGVRLEFGKEVKELSALEDADLLVAADGANGIARATHGKEFGTSVDWRQNRFVWLGTTYPFRAFTFHFKDDGSGLWRAHAYRYDDGHSTFILETTAETLGRAGLRPEDEDSTVAFTERLFERELDGHRILKNRSLWRSFPIIRNRQWRHRNIVLLGDAAHTAHFSIGSGTRLALDDAIALRDAVRDHRDLAKALAAYEAARRPVVESFQRAAQVSLQWFEDTERYMDHEPVQFGFSLLTRSFRVTHGELARRDPEYVKSIDRWFAERAGKAAGVRIDDDPPPPPMFTPFKVRSLLLQNRVVVSPMCMYSADDGEVNDWHLVHLGSRAVGGAGLVIAEMTDVSREARITPGCAGMYKDSHVAAWNRIVEFVHRNSGAKIGIQLGHAGRKGATRRAWEGMDVALGGSGWEVVAPSPIPYSAGSRIPREMDRADMEKVRDEFLTAVERSARAGFDWLELHFAHGYLLSTFISPLTNRRKDDYGGSLENRMRFPLEVLDAARSAWPAERPLSVRISATDWAPGGLEPGDAVEVARMLKAHGCDMVDVSAGQVVEDAKPVYGRQFQTPFSERVRIEAGVATMAVGNITSYADVNTILAAGRADLCVLARAHLYDPYWTRHAAHALGYSVDWPPQYQSIQRFTPRFD
jgi:anthraniloyl-CoA monooxygenase